MKYIAKLIDRNGFVKEVEIPEEHFNRGMLYFAKHVPLSIANMGDIEMEISKPQKETCLFVIDRQSIQQITTVTFKESP